MNASSPERPERGGTGGTRKRHLWMVIAACLVVAGALMVARKPSGPPPISLQFLGRDTARIGASPIGIFTISNTLSRPVQWSMKVEPVQADTRFDFDQMLSSYAAAGQLAPSQLVEFRTLVPAGENAGFRVVVFEFVRSLWLERWYFAVGQKLPILLKIWKASPQKTRTIYTSVLGEQEQE